MLSHSSSFTNPTDLSIFESNCASEMKSLLAYFEVHLIQGCLSSLRFICNWNRNVPLKDEAPTLSLFHKSATSSLKWAAGWRRYSQTLFSNIKETITLHFSYICKIRKMKLLFITSVLCLWQTYLHSKCTDNQPMQVQPPQWVCEQGTHPWDLSCSMVWTLNMSTKGNIQ